MIAPVLVGTLVTGASFIGIALASQRGPVAPPRGGSSIIASPRDFLLEETSPPVPRFDVVSSRSAPASAPVSLDIEAIDVHSDLHHVGLDAAGAIATPSGALYDQAAWYKHSPTPGSVGPAIIVGHVDSAADGPSVFFRLGELARGDRISVTGADGSVASFVVDAVKRYAKDDFPTNLVYGDLDHAGLRLVTCGGEFDQVAGHYRDNIVVFASLVT